MSAQTISRWLQEAMEHHDWFLLGLAQYNQSISVKRKRAVTGPGKVWAETFELYQFITEADISGRSDFSSRRRNDLHRIIRELGGPSCLDIQDLDTLYAHYHGSLEMTWKLYDCEMAINEFEAKNDLIEIEREAARKFDKETRRKKRTASILWSRLLNLPLHILDH